MWFERFASSVVSSLERDFPPSVFAQMLAGFEIATFVGTLGLFFTMFMLFCRFVPVIAIAEIKGVLRPAHGSHHAHDSYSGYSEEVSPEEPPL
jgi:molybdopterin-containing oxidoreductase family membrane subunit